jgi:hypothetical protein
MGQSFSWDSEKILDCVGVMVAWQSECTNATELCT